MSTLEDIKMTKREKALLTIIIAEIQGCQDMKEVKAITDSWVIANDLHPEEVKPLSQDELNRLLRIR